MIEFYAETLLPALATVAPATAVAATATAASATTTGRTTTRASTKASATAAATKATRTITALFGDLHAERTAIEEHPIELVDRTLRSFGRPHCDECKTTRSAGFAIENDFNFLDVATLGERISDGVFCC